MKFEKKHPQARSTDRFEFEYSYVTKTPKLGQCRWCGACTRWLDVLFQHHACGEECLGAMWRQYKDDQKKKSSYENFESHFERVKEELRAAEGARPSRKDIVIVVRDQLDYFRDCVAGVRRHTRDYHLYVWDNGSRADTRRYLDELAASRPEDADWQLTVVRSERNAGFVAPNNYMAALGDGDYLILLNSDTKVFDGWDRAMTGFLEAHPEVAQVGYWGGHMGPDGRGFGGANGYEVDYIPGWCFCVARTTYEEHGLFDPRYHFAYCEDADLSLRLKAAGRKVYALHAPLVHHYQNKTIVEVEREGAVDVKSTFDHNHEYLKSRWAHYLLHERVLLRQKGTDSDGCSHEAAGAV